MDKKIPKLELEKVLLRDAAEIVASHEKARIIHRTRDIDAAGEEVERTVGRVLRSKLPDIYYVGHGHIVDLQLNTSPEMDIVIADNKGSPILLRSEDGTEYFPYESVYAVGEVKSTYYRHKNYVHSFVEAINHTRSILRRGVVLDLGQGAPFIVDPDSAIAGGLNYRRRRNPLFSFMLFVDSNDFKPDHLRDLYLSTPAESLPNIICFLDKGVVLNMKCAPAGGGFNISGVNILPEFNKEGGDVLNYWGFVRLGGESNHIGLNYGYLYYALASHLGGCLLSRPNLTSYFGRFFGFGECEVFTPV